MKGNVLTELTYWRQHTLNKNKVIFTARAAGINLKHWVDDYLWTQFVEWVVNQYGTDVQAWMLTDFVDAYVVFDAQFVRAEL